MTPPPEPILRVENLRVEFPVGAGPASSLFHRRVQERLQAVAGVDLEIRRGETLGVVGESGCGKSTLARTIAGLQPATEGTIHLDGQPLGSRRSVSERRRIQMVFQDPYSSLNPRMPVRKVLSELLSLHEAVAREEIENRCQELMRLVGMPPRSLDSLPRAFSGGQRQRLAIARALAPRPALLIADEPVSALDVSVQATILNLFSDFRDELGLTVMLIAHNLGVVGHICDRVAVMYLGRIVELAPTAELFENPQHPYTRALLAAVPKLDPAQRTNVAAVAGDPPSPISPPPGCPFHPRCPLAQDICTREPPGLEGPAPGEHQAACHFAFGDLPATVPASSPRSA